MSAFVTGDFSAISIRTDNHFTPRIQIVMKNGSKRARLFDARFDPLSDEETEINVDVTHHSPSGKTNYSFTQSTRKRPRNAENVGGDSTPSVLSTSPLKPGDGPSNEGCSQAHFAVVDNDQENNKCQQGASVNMRAFSREIYNLQAAILEKEHHPNSDLPCQCGSVAAKYRCRGCTQDFLRCQSCAINDHLLSAWHHLEEWTGTHFARTSLSCIGYIYQLGHFGRPCPNRAPGSPICNMVVMHTNGFHNVDIGFCACDGSQSPPYQLMAANLFPASLEKPQTAFTHEVLESYQKLSLRSKINAYDFHRSLQEMTNAVFVHNVPNRYQEFVRVSRVWGHLAQMRRSGQCHNFDELFPHRRPGSFAVRCPACPEVHFNVNLQTLQLAGEDEMHKYTLYLSADGNFKLQRKKKRGDPDDISLNNGRGFFVASAPYALYLEHTKEECDETCVCAHLRALKFRNIMRFKNADISGVIIVQCARHGFYQPQGVADLKRGEAFRNTDYVLASALADAHDQRWIMLTYDIWCSYYKNLEKRFEKWFHQMLPIIQKVRGAVPKLHIKGHELDCQYTWALNYLPYSGETTGELIEACHSEQNGAAASTKEQNPGHRHDTLDSILNYWNFTKFCNMGSSLHRSYLKCLETLKIREKAFIDFTARFEPKLIAQWEKTDDTPRIVNKQVQSVHRPNLTKGLPTFAQTREKLLLEECTQKRAGVPGWGVTDVISKALDIEQYQVEIQTMLKHGVHSDAERLKLVSARECLHVKVNEWRQQQFALFPKVENEYQDKVLDAIYPPNPENEVLLLPSDFSESHRRYLGLEDGQRVERELREGRARDHLEDVRTAIQTYNHHIALKAKEVRSQRHITRAQNIIKGLQEDIRKPAHQYNKTRDALLKLGLSPADPVLRQLKDNELWAKNTALPARLGDSRTEDPWYWNVNCPTSGSLAEKKEFQNESELYGKLCGSAEYHSQMDRVKYFRDRSLRNRAREEKDILEEEFKRTICSYQALQLAWTSQAAKTSSLGSKAYAHRQAGIFERLGQECEKKYSDSWEKGQDYDRW
ncbi:LOW QUALITY PROTEIN: hypothetical protein CVT26_015366 [Gymnopilus dilepis]|uniref:CxC2-like cysteine cluster KDZ transposase-associated domain-containing protein n=1 Tax=Gymnopilus dilepis TaxID=231916 RepID=A0A409WD38_9AGAR|nr:LOW QUALITY PROTEIN: hypothetical protein CVT26_015366 [Gymnopilus dilepis]